MQKQTEKRLIIESHKFCKNVATKHYENFPVASKLLPKNIRIPVFTIYAYARYADDIVDSAKLNASKKQALIHKIKNIINNINEISYFEISKISNDDKNLKFLAALKSSIYKNNIPINLLIDLLIAFEQDIFKSEYENMDSLLKYCKYSADPIGRLMLSLIKIKDEETLKASDAICTSLQLINFMQDITSDFHERNRCYIPIDILKKYSLKIIDIKSRTPDIAWKNARNEILIFSENLIIENKNILLKNLHGRFKFEIKFIIYSALYLIKKFKKTKFSQKNIFDRPHLSKFDFCKIFIRMFF